MCLHVWGSGVRGTAPLKDAPQKEGGHSELLLVCVNVTVSICMSGVYLCLFVFVSVSVCAFVYGPVCV